MGAVGVAHEDEADEVWFLLGKGGCVAHHSLAEVNAHPFWEGMVVASRLVCVMHQQPAIVLEVAHAHQKSLGASPRVHLMHVLKRWQHLHSKVSDKRRDARRVPVDLRLLMCALQHPFVVWFPGLQLRVLCSTYAL